MARRRRGELSPRGDTAVSGPLAAFMSPGSQRMGGERRGRPLSDLELNLRVAETRALSGEWEGATGPVFVGLYALCHRLAYAVLPLELEERREFSLASRAALSTLHAHFDDDCDAFVGYVRWAWLREQGRVAWAKSQSIERNRLGWRLVFSARMVTDYRATRSR